MKRALATLLILAAASTALAGKKSGVDPSTYWAGKSPEEAAAALLAAGREAADDGSWENIAVARVWYLAGRKDLAQPILDRYAGADSKEETDLYRIGRIYCEAGEHDKAQRLFERSLALEPRSDKTMVAMGACAMMAGEREKAETWFRRALELNPENPYRFATIAAAYLGVLPDLN